MKHNMIQTEKTAKISALSFDNVISNNSNNKYEYLTGEDLGLKPRYVEEAKFEYSPLGKIFTKGLDKDDQKEGLFKKLKNIENAQKDLIRGNDNGIEFPVQEKDFNKVDLKNNICINLFGYENELIFRIYLSDQKFEDSMDLLHLNDDGKSHYLYIKDFDRFMFHKTKNSSVKVVYSVLIAKMCRQNINKLL